MAFVSKYTLMGSTSPLPLDTNDTPGTDPGAKFMNNGESADAERFNRAMAALADNTDYLYGKVTSNKAQLEIAELNSFVSAATISVDPNALGGGDYDLDPAGYLYLGGSSYSGGGQEERDFLFQLLNEDYSPVIVNGSIVKVSTIGGTGSPALGSGFWNTDVVNLGLSATIPTGNYRLLLARDTTLEAIPEDAAYKGLTRYAHAHPNYQGLTAIITDGTNSSGGDYNGANAIDILGSFTYGGQFLLKPGRYTWNSITEMLNAGVVVTGERYQWGADANADLTSLEIPAGASANFALWGTYKNVILSSKTSSWVYSLGYLDLENVQMQAGMAGVHGPVRWRGGGTTGSLTGNTNTNDTGLLIQALSDPIVGTIEDCTFGPPPTSGAFTYSVYMTGLSAGDALEFNNCVFTAEGSAGTVACRISSTGNLTFNNCRFLGSDGGYALQCSGGQTEFNNCTFENDYGKIIYSASGTTAGPKYNNCTFKSGTSSPTTLEKAVVATGGFFNDCRFELGSSSIDTNPGTATAHVLEFGGDSQWFGMNNVVIEMPATWHGYTPIAIYGPGIFYGNLARVIDLTVVAGASGPASDRTTNGELGYAGVLEIIGEPGEPDSLLNIRNLRIVEVGQGLSAHEAGTVFAAKNCVIDGLLIDGDPSGTSFEIGNGAGVVYAVEDVRIKNFVYCPKYEIDCSHSPTVHLGNRCGIDGGNIVDFGAGGSYFFGSPANADGVYIINLMCPNVTGWGLSKAILVNGASCAQFTFHNNTMYFGGTGNNSTVLIKPEGPNARITNNTIVIGRSSNPAVDLTSNAGCIIDGNIFNFLGGGGPTFLNTGGTGTTVGDNAVL